MRCYICDRLLTEEETHYNKKHKGLDPCGTCMEIINSLFDPMEDDPVLLGVDVQYELDFGEELDKPSKPRYNEGIDNDRDP